jgi:hypothetical protein
MLKSGYIHSCDIDTGYQSEWMIFRKSRIQSLLCIYIVYLIRINK